MNAPAPLAVIGAGLIGAGWAALFALRGHAVRVADPAPGARRLVLDTLEEAGEGALRRAYEALKAKLEAEGLFDAARKRPLPAHVRRLAVLTSPTGLAGLWRRVRGEGASSKPPASAPAE